MLNQNRVSVALSDAIHIELHVHPLFLPPNPFFLQVSSSPQEQEKLMKCMWHTRPARHWAHQKGVRKNGEYGRLAWTRWMANRLMEPSSHRALPFSISQYP